jgi:hypothetical protein
MQIVYADKHQGHMFGSLDLAFENTPNCGENSLKRYESRSLHPELY